ncbi:MAG: hypothetical protein L6R37_007394 [Teloschistes peruensis]|nr:MAG: hypothetical protein L6R37_007394 [Teloschistes peruensis]
MLHTFLLASLALIIFLPAVNAQLFDAEVYAKRTFPFPNYRFYSRVNEPKIDSDVLNFGPAPTERDKVETAIYDALQLVMVTLAKIDQETTIFPDYSSRRDKGKVKRVIERLAGECLVGNSMLAKITIRTHDTMAPQGKGCGHDSVAYTFSYQDDLPRIVISPLGFKKRAYTTIRGVGGSYEDDPDHYVRCREIRAIGRVSVHMETLGSALLHKYMHFDHLMFDIYGKSIDDQELRGGRAAYGPSAVYNNLNKNLLSRTNPDSYSIYAVQVFWSEVCQFSFAAPQYPTDDVDPDCQSLSSLTGSDSSCVVQQKSRKRLRG